MHSWMDGDHCIAAIAAARELCTDLMHRRGRVPSLSAEILGSERRAASLRSDASAAFRKQASARASTRLHRDLMRGGGIADSPDKAVVHTRRL